jgi:hypothetical protein
MTIESPSAVMPLPSNIRDDIQVKNQGESCQIISFAMPPRVSRVCSILSDQKAAFRRMRVPHLCDLAGINFADCPYMTVVAAVGETNPIG